MKATKLTPGEQLFAATNNIDFLTWLVEKKRSRQESKN